MQRRLPISDVVDSVPTRLYIFSSMFCYIVIYQIQNSFVKVEEWKLEINSRKWRDVVDEGDGHFMTIWTCPVGEESKVSEIFAMKKVMKEISMQES